MSNKLWRVNEEELEYVAKAIDSGLTGEYTKEFEIRFASQFDSKYAIALNSGTSALHVALGAINIQPGDEVIVPPLTFAATAFSVLYMGAVPVFADVDVKTFNIDPAKIKEKISDKTKAIITVSLYGLSPEMDEIMNIAKDNNLKVVEDNAQCVMGKYKGRVVGSIGDIAIFSLQRSKHLTTGDGGVLITSDEKLAERARKFSDLGYRKLSAGSIFNENFKEEIQRPNYKRHEFVGYNFRMPEVCAAMGLAQLDKIDMLVEKRKACGELYLEAVSGCEWLIPQYTSTDIEHSYWTFVLRLDTSKIDISWNDFREKFISEGGKTFYGTWSLTYLEPAIEGMEFPDNKSKLEKGLCPVAESLQPYLIQLKTNFENLAFAKEQANVLSRVIKHFERKIGLSE